MSSATTIRRWPQRSARLEWPSFLETVVRAELVDSHSSRGDWVIRVYLDQHAPYLIKTRPGTRCDP
jgi:hypothetical protein